MPLWGLTDAAANSVKYATELVRSGPVGNSNANKAANNTPLYANVSSSAYTNGMVVGQFAVTSQEMANTSATERGHPAHAGWNMRYAGTGPVANVTVSAGGTGYSNTNLVKVSGNNVTNASGSILTNGTGVIQSVTLTEPGYGFISVARSAISVTNATGGATGIGTGATLTFALGGRAGRLQYETIVASGALTSTGNTIPANT
jgi:hypothetical protein